MRRKTFHMNYIDIFTDIASDERNMHRSHGSQGDRSEDTKFNEKGKL